VPLELPENLLRFVDEVVDSFVTWDLLVGFTKRPDTSGTAANFSSLLGRPVADVIASLEGLYQKGILNRRELNGGDVFFELKTDSLRMSDLRTFSAFNESQENRLKILSRLLQRGVQR
jgi:hypothetical protein